MDLYFFNRLCQLAYPIRVDTGVHLKLLVGNDHTDLAAMNFDTVFINKRMARFSDAELSCVLLHEWGHRLVSPRSPHFDTQIRHHLIHEHDIDKDVAHMLTAIAYDILVDHFYSTHDKWGKLYGETVTGFFHWIFDDYIKQSKTTNQCQDEYTVNMMQFCLRMLNLGNSDLPIELEAFQQVASSLLNRILDKQFTLSDQHHQQRVIDFALALYDWIPQSQKNNRNGFLITFEELTSVLLKTAPFPTTLAFEFPDISMTGTGHAETRQTTSKSTSFDLTLVRQVTHFLQQNRCSARPIPALWQEQHALRELDIKRSLRCYPELLPGLTTRRMTPGRQNKKHGNETTAYCLVIDDSASMSGKPAQFARSLAEGINRFALYQKKPIGLLIFGNDVKQAYKPGYRHHQLTEHLQNLDGNLGGTNLSPALETLYAWFSDNITIGDIWIITDAELESWTELVQLTSRLIPEGKITFLLLNTTVPKEFKSHFKQYRERIRFLHCNPEAPINNNFLKETLL